MKLDLVTLARVSAQRDPYFGADIANWTLADWSNAMAGEAGEACNIVKKIRRGDFTLEEARPALAKELADILIYVVILAEKSGVDIELATIAKFDETSKKVGFPYSLAEILTVQAFRS